MVFSDSTNKAGIVEDIDFLAISDSVSYPIAQKTRNANRAMDKVVSLIFNSDGVWEWDDSNQTDLPIATTNLVSGQYDYAFAVSHLKINRVLVKDSSGNWSTIDQFDNTEDKAVPFLVGGASGKPQAYNKMAGSIFLYPTPDYNSTGGLKIIFQRPSTYFTVADTTKEPGFASIFHRYLSLSAAYDYCLAKKLDKLPLLKKEMTDMEQAIEVFYSNRNDRDVPTRFIPKLRNYE